MATDEPRTDDAFGGYRGMWRSAEDDCRRLRGRAEAAEQRVRELERGWDGWEAKYQERLAEIESLMRSIKVMDNERADLRAKLATAVEALTGTRNFLANVMRRFETGPPPSWADVKEALRQAEEGRARALSEIEQGDAK